MVDPTAVYDLTQEIGRGTYGSVWKARHKRTGNVVAIKIVMVDPDSGDLEREVQILKQCESEFCVGYLGTYERSDAVWIVMEYCPAGSVADLMSFCDRTLEEEEIADVTAFVLLGLEFLHAKQLIHRDIKAGNILLAADGQVKLGDFGVAAKLGTLQSRVSSIVGAPYWMAPEVIAEQPYNSLCDIWSLGITLIELAQGKPPHSDMNPLAVIFHIPKQPIPVFAHPQRWSTHMNDFLARCLVRDPARRSSAGDLMTHPFVEERVRAISKADNTSRVVARMVTASQAAIERGRSQRKLSASAGSTLPASLQGTLKTGP